MGIRDKPIAPGSPWQNGFAERLIGSIRRECVDHVIALGEAHLRRILQAYAHDCGCAARQNADRPNLWASLDHLAAVCGDAIMRCLPRITCPNGSRALLQRSENAPLV